MIRMKNRNPQLVLEALEAREVPASLNWVGPNAGGLWSTAANWSTNHAPVSGDSVFIHSGVSSIQDIAGLSVQQIELNGNDTVTLQKQLTLNGALGTDEVVNFGSSAINTFTGAGGLNLAGSGDFNTGFLSRLILDTNLSGASNLEKVGPGVLELRGTASYTGSTYVDDGVLVLNSPTIDQSIPGTNLFIGDGTGINGTARVGLLQGIEIPDACTITIASDGVLDFGGQADGVGNITLFGGLIDIDGGNLTLDGTISVTKSGTVIDTGTTPGQIFLPTTRTVFVDSGKFMDLGSQLTGPGGLIKDGPGKLALSPFAGSSGLANTYTGATTVKDGTLLLNGAKSDAEFGGALVIGDGTGPPQSAIVQLQQGLQIPDSAHVTIRGDGQLDLNGHSDTVGPITLDGGAVVLTKGGTLFLNGNVDVTAGGTGAAAIFGNLYFSSTDRTFTVADNVAGSDLVISGVIDGALNGGLIKDGHGQLELQGAAGSPNTFIGTTRVKDGILALNHGGVGEAIRGALEIGDGTGAAGSAVVRLLQASQLPSTESVTIHSDGRLDLNGFLQGLDSLTLDGGAAVTTSPNTLGLFGDITRTAVGTGDATITGTVQLNNGNHTFTVLPTAPGDDLRVNANLSGTGGLIKTGQGVLALYGSDSYAGPTFLDGGALIVNGAITNSSITLNDGTLGGTGTVGVVNAIAGVIAPGSGGTGTLSAKSLSLGSAVFTPELNGAGTFDQIKVIGTADLSGGTLLPALNFVPTTGQQFKVIDNDGTDAVSGTFNNLPEGATLTLNGLQFKVTYKGDDGNDVVLTALTGNRAGPILGGPIPIGQNRVDLLAVSAGAGTPSHVRVFNGDGSVRFDLDPFGSYAGGVSVATGDVTGDGVDDIVVGAGPGAPGGHVKVFDGATGTEIRSFLAFSGFSGGVNVGAGDLDSDGRAEILVGAGAGTPGGHVKAFDAITNAEVRSFFAYLGYSGGVNVSAGDIDGDGRAEIITGTATMSSHVKAFDGQSGDPVRSFFAFDGSPGGVNVGAGDLDGDGRAEILVGAASSVSHVKAFDGATNDLVRSAIAFPGFRGGASVTGFDRDNDGRAEIAVGAGNSGNGRVTVLSALTDSALTSFFALENVANAPVFVG